MLEKITAKSSAAEIELQIEMAAFAKSKRALGETNYAFAFGNLQSLITRIAQECPKARRMVNQYLEFEHPFDRQTVAS